MISQQNIIDFCQQYNYDLRKSRNGRWIDQKCTADVITVVADCMYNYFLQKGDIQFSSKDIWYSQYAITNITEIFKKPDPNIKSAKHEYDKFFQQPMEMLANANVLLKIKHGKRTSIE